MTPDRTTAGASSPWLGDRIAELPSRLARAGRWAALALATVGPLLGIAALLLFRSHPPRAFYVASSFLLGSAALAHHARSGSQILARSVWWANLVLGMLLALAGNDHERAMGVGLVVGDALPLLAMGRLGLDERDDSAFRPNAFRGTLSVAMIMAVADVQALLFFAALKLDAQGWRRDDEGPRAAVLLVLAASVIAVAIVGLYRLRVWGLLLGSVGAAFVLALGVSNVCDMRSPAPESLVVTSIVQLLLPVPVLIAIARGSHAPRRDGVGGGIGARVLPRLPFLIVAGLAILALVDVLLGWRAIR